MPRETTVDVKALVAVLKEHVSEIRNENSKKINPTSNPVWKKIQGKLNFNISLNYLYSIVLLNRFNVMETLGFDEEPASSSFEVQYEDNDNDSISIENENNEETETIMKFKMTLSVEEWNGMITDPMSYNRKDRPNTMRSYPVLMPYEWTGPINEHFFELTKKPCCLSFKRNKILPDGNNFLQFEARCTTCNSLLIGIVTNPPAPDSRVVIDCSYNGNYQSCSGGKKRRMLNSKRSEYETKMLDGNISASFLQRKEASKLMNFGDCEPSHLPTLNALRLLKHKAYKKSLIDSDPLLAIARLKGSYPFNGIIRDVGYDKFFMHYWTASELNAYRTYARKEKHPCISIDATGGVVKRFTLQTGRETGAIFLYEVVVKDRKHSNSQFAVGHMLSERHSNIAIKGWLSEWLNNDIPLPKIVVVDQSKALIMAVVNTFTQYSTLNKYLAVCSALLRNEVQSSEIPNCMIRLDFNHTMSLVSKWNEFNNASPRFKNFYMRSIGLIISCTDFNEAKHLLWCIFSTAFSETEGLKLDKHSTSCEIAKSYLKNKISSHADVNDIEFEKFKMTYDGDDSENLENYTIDEEDTPSTSIFEEIQTSFNLCLEEAKCENNNGDRDNLQYSPGIAKKLLALCKLLPLWSAVMIPIFEYGNITESSASSESMFNDLKHRVFHHKPLPIRIDEFVQIHLESITGSMNIVSSKFQKVPEMLNTSVIEENTPEKENNDEVREFSEENWGGEVVEQKGKKTQQNDLDADPTVIPTENNDDIGKISEENRGDEVVKHKEKKRKRNYLDADPTILSYNDSSKSKCPVIGLLRNGTSSHLKGVDIGDQNYTFTNTCTFDTIAQILFCSYADSKVYSNFIDNNSEQSTYYKLIQNGVRDGITVQCYRKRAQILLEIFEQERSQKLGGSITIDSSCAANLMITRLFRKYPCYTELRKCNSCNWENNRAQETVLVNLPKEDLQSLQQAISNYFEDSVRCGSCGNTPINRNFTIGSHLFIETVTNSIPYESEFSIPLSNVPENLTILGKIFKLRGIVSFIPPITKKVSAIGHYVAYCWRSHLNSWEKYDDLIKVDRKKSVRSNTVVNCQYVVYTL